MQVKSVMLLEEQKENTRKEQKGSQPQRTAKQILRLRNDPPRQTEPAWKQMERRSDRARQQQNWVPARSRQQLHSVTGSATAASFNRTLRPCSAVAGGSSARSGHSQQHQQNAEGLHDEATPGSGRAQRFVSAVLMTGAVC